MRLKISHRTQYVYDAPAPYALQRVRLFPPDIRGQSVLHWSIEVEGAKQELRFSDHFGNDTRLLSIEGDTHEMVVTAEGEVETQDLTGILGPHRGFAPLWIFTPQTDRTMPGDTIRELAASIGDGSELARLHALMAAIGERVIYQVGATDVGTAAEEALQKGSGVCQDHAHIFLSAARLMGMPARYISGYLLLDGTTEQAASHAWAEAHIDGLGWVGFDPANGISPDDRYVRLATGRDYRDAMPVSGIRTGMSNERLAVNITVEQ